MTYVSMQLVIFGCETNISYDSSCGRYWLVEAVGGLTLWVPDYPKTRRTVSQHGQDFILGRIAISASFTSSLQALDLIKALQPIKIITDHLEQGWEQDAKADMADNRKYLEPFVDQITNAKTKPKVDELYHDFKDAFPQASR